MTVELKLYQRQDRDNRRVKFLLEARGFVSRDYSEYELARRGSPPSGLAREVTEDMTAELEHKFYGTIREILDEINELTAKVSGTDQKDPEHDRTLLSLFDRITRARNACTFAKCPVSKRYEDIGVFQEPTNNESG